MSVVVRLPDDVYESAKQFAALSGKQPGELIGEAWGQYVEANRETLASNLEAAAQALRDGHAPGNASVTRP